MMLSNIGSTKKWRTVFHQKNFYLGVVFLLFLVYGVLLLRTSWLSDDAYITFRTIDNWFNGYGLRWNILERVQSYTHPLWMFVLSGAHAVTGEFFYTVQIVSIAVSFFAVVLLVRVAPSYRNAVVPLVLLLSSKAFVDYSTSGLENPLSYLLLAGFFTVWQKTPSAKNLFWLSLFTSLVMLNRMDLILLFGPALLQYLYRLINSNHVQKKETAAKQISIYIGIMLIGCIPFIAWEIFSVVYYGFPFPNTAYAKLSTHIPYSILYQKGLLYILESIVRDPITILAIISGTVFLLAKKRTHWPLILGIILYILYIIRIGGDFMSGRYFAILLFAMALVLTQIDWGKKWVVPFFSYIIIVCTLFFTPNPSFITPMDYLNRTHLFHIADERGHYYSFSNLFIESPDGVLPDHPNMRKGLQAQKDGETLSTAFSIGYFAFAAGPQVHVLDLYALSDPLLVRMPRLPGGWRPGHIRRVIPSGYIQSIRNGTNEILDPNVAEAYTVLQHITQGPIWDKQRFISIYKMNTGFYDLTDVSIR